MYAIVSRSSQNWKHKSGNFNKLNTDWLFETDNKYGFPVVHSSPNFVATDLLPFNLSKKQLKQDVQSKAVHFFIDDYQFEQVWTSPFKYVKMFKNYGNIVSPQFSVYSVLPYALNLFNIYRSRYLTKFYQQFDINVLVNVYWGDSSTFEFCFSGIKRNTPIILNTVGTKLIINRKLFIDGFYEMLKRIEPSDLYIYGEYMPVNFEKYFDNVTYFKTFFQQRRLLMKGFCDSIWAQEEEEQEPEAVEEELHRVAVKI